MERIRVVVAMRDGLARDLVVERLAVEPDIDLLTAPADLSRLDASMLARHPAVIVLTSSDGSLPEPCRELLIDHGIAVVAVAADERTARVIEVRETEIARLEPEDVLAAIRAVAETSSPSPRRIPPPIQGTRPSLHPS